VDRAPDDKRLLWRKFKLDATTSLIPEVETPKDNDLHGKRVIKEWHRLRHSILFIMVIEQSLFSDYAQKKFM